VPVATGRAAGRLPRLTSNSAGAKCNRRDAEVRATASGRRQAGDEVAKLRSSVRAFTPLRPRTPNVLPLTCAAFTRQNTKA